MKHILYKQVPTALSVMLTVAALFLLIGVYQAFAALSWNNGGGITNGSTPSATNVVSTSTLASNMLVVLCMHHEQTATVSSITDTFGLSWTKVASGNNGTSMYEDMYYAFTGSSSGAWTATTTYSNANPSYRNIAFDAYSGFTSPTLDKAASSTGASGNPSVPSTTTGHANEVIVACADNFSNSSNFTAGSGYTRRQNLTGNDGLGVEDRIASSVSNFTAPFTQGVSTIWIDIMGTFYDSVAPSAPDHGVATLSSGVLNISNSLVTIK